MRSWGWIGWLVLSTTVLVAARAVSAQSSDTPAIPRQVFGSSPPPESARTADPARSAELRSPNESNVALPSTGGVAGATIAGDAAIPVSYFRQPTFTIPYNVAPDVVEVQLYVSIDGGASWHLYAQEKPEIKRFRFRASRDGEFWFTSRTVDRAGQGRPETVTKPERRVIVDSHQPQLNLQAAIDADGQVQVSWEAVDEYLSPKTFRLGFRTDQNPKWQLVPGAQLSTAAGKTATGSIQWRPPLGARALQLHVEVADAAGNWGVVERQMTIPAGAGRRPNTGVTAGTAGATGLAVTGAGTGSTMGATPNSTAGSDAAGPGRMTSTVPAVPPTGSGDDRPPGSSPLTTDTPGYSAGGFPQSAGSTGSNNAASTNPSVGATSPPVDLPGNERPRMSASRRFSLEYDIESAGPGGVADVELWMTSDRGATWTKHGTDPDKASPMDVEVSADGIYGVRIVVISGSGLASSAPRANDPADLWIGVDTARPNVQFASVSYGEGPKAGLLDIRWIADDQRFGPRPITLAYAESTNGPWTTIAAGLANTGQYYWAVDPHVPKKVVLRVEARDEAGNTAQHELTDPINLQGLSPAARIRAVQPK